jgi:hypothetical protein
VNTFEIKAPDGRLLRQEHPSIEVFKASLAPGYELVGIVVGASADGSGGVVEKIGGPVADEGPTRRARRRVTGVAEGSCL